MARSDRTWEEPGGHEPDSEGSTLPYALGSGFRADDADVPVEHPGRYDERGVLGQGGLGTVFRVRDTVVGREVALKVLHRRPDAPRSSRATEVRFLREARITAALQHPGIIPVHEIGRRADGTLYYTMKRVRGRTLAQQLAVCTSLVERLGLLPEMLQVSNAIAYAHSRGVLHRDLKPSNIMIGEFGEALVVDWGLARTSGEVDPEILDLPMPASSDHTAVGSVLGTPQYMSPEQAAGKDLDARSDVWSLGVVLFEVITGSPPFEGEPTDVIAEIRYGIAPRVRERCPEVAPDLAAIVEHALAGNPADRYPSAKELAVDLEAWLTGGRVSAYRYRTGELARRFLVQNWAAVTIAVLAAAALGLGGLVSTATLRREREVAVVALARALREEGAAAQATDPIRAAAYTAASLAAHETQEARGDALATAGRWAPRLVASWSGEGCDALAWTPAGDLACALGDHVSVFPGGGGAELRRVTGLSGVALALEVAADGSVAVGTDRGWVQRWDAGGKRVLDSVVAGPVRAVAFAPDGALLAADPWELVRFEADGAASARLSVPTAVVALVAGAEGVAFATGTEIWSVDPAGLSVVAKRPGPGPTLRGLAASGGRLAVATADGSAAVATGDGWRPIGVEGGPGRVALAVGERLVDVREAGRVRFLDGAALTVAELPGRPSAVAVDPAGARLAASSRGRGIALWSLEDDPDASPRRFRVDEATPDAAGLQAPARLRVAALEDGGVAWIAGDRTRVFGRDGAPRGVVDTPWLDDAARPALPPHRLAVQLPDGRVFATDEGGSFVTNPAVGPTPTARYDVAPGWVVAGAEDVVVEHPDGLAILRLGTGAVEAHDLPGGPGVRASPDGTLVAVPESDAGTVDLLEVGPGKVRISVALPAPVGEVALGPRGELLAAVFGPDRSLGLVDTRDGRVRAVVPLTTPVRALAFDPLGRWLVLAAADGEVRSLDLRELDVPGEALVARSDEVHGVRIVDGRLTTTRP